MAISRVMRAEHAADRSLSGIGGVERGGDAAEFLLLGASTVQVRCPMSVPCQPSRSSSGALSASTFVQPKVRCALCPCVASFSQRVRF